MFASIYKTKEIGSVQAVGWVNSNSCPNTYEQRNKGKVSSIVRLIDYYKVICYWESL